MSGNLNVSATEASLFDTERYVTDSFERAQSALRTILAAHFHSNRHAWKIVTLLRQRIATSQYESTVCDLCILSADAPVERVIRSAPMICIDILSEEPLAVVQNRVDTYEKLGVKHIWLLDAVHRRAWRATSAGLFPMRDEQLVISGTSIGMRLTSIFEELDELMEPVKRMSVAAAIDRSRSRS